MSRVDPVRRSAPCSSTAAANLTSRPQARCWRRRPTTFRQFLDQQQIFVFFITVIGRGAGLIANDRRANALQIYLSEAADRGAEYVARQSSPSSMAFLAARHVAAGHRRCSSCRLLFAGNFTLLQEQRLPVPGDHRFLVHRGRHARHVDDAGAVVAVEEQPLRGAVSMRRSSSSRQAVYGVLYAVHAAARRSRGCRSRPTSRRWATPSSASRCRATRRGELSLLMIVGADRRLRA